ncbi:UNVERIFIED_CONTAM: Pentatricopeptide repeat-containing protein [Sesamum radiatum]|uniref:Pentatricopeptide repeat-containing protein n=1 Tax=Sesamum radiatum TaxID=300843 RepID=A0AAW2MWC9_SESRA
MSSAEHFCLSLLNNCRTLRYLQQIHAHVTKTGIDSNPLVAGKLLLHCAVHLCGALEYATRFLRYSSNPDPFMYNALIRGFSDSDLPQNSISTFSLMLKNLDSPVDSFSLAFTLKSAANMRCLRTGIQLHCQALTRGLDTHLFVGTTLISMYAECGCVGFAERMFDEIPEPNVVTWNAVVTAFFRCGDVKSAERVFSSMPAKSLASYNLMLAGYTKLEEFELARRVFGEMPRRDEVSWSTMIVGFAQHGCFDEAFGYFRELLRVEMRPNEVSLTGVLSACAQAGALEFAKILHGFIEKVGLVWITPVNNALMDTYSKCGNVDMARLVFQRMPGKRSIVSWTSMIVGLAIQGHGEEALSLFHEMEESGIDPDGIAFIAILYACSHSGLVEQGQKVFDKMTQVYGIKPDIEHYGCMVDLYGRAGQLLKAYHFVTQLPIPPNAVIWRTLLGACSFYGNVKLAEQSEKSMAELKLTKTPGWSMIEVNKAIYTFIAGAKEDDVTKEAYKKLKEIMLKLRVEGGYVPEVVNVLHDIQEEEKEDAIITHSEKLAVAFGMARLPENRQAWKVTIPETMPEYEDIHCFLEAFGRSWL